MNPFNLKQKLLLLLLLASGASVLLVGATLSYMAQQLYRSESRTKLAEARHAIAERFDAMGEGAQKSARALAERSDVISTVNMVFTYQSKSDYQSWVFDPEKRALAKELRNHISSGFGSRDGQRLSIYDGRGDLVSFALNDGRTTQAGYVAFDRGAPVAYVAQTETTDTWQAAAVPPAFTIAPADLKPEGFRLCPGRVLAATSAIPIVRAHASGAPTTIGHVVAAEAFGDNLMQELSKSLGTRLAIVLKGEFITGNLGTRDIPAEAHRGVARLFQEEQAPWFETEDYFLQAYALPLTTGGAAHLILGIEKRPIMAQITRTRVITVGVLVVVALLVTPFWILLARRAISDPVSRLVHAVAAIKEGHYEVEVSGYSADEFGTLAHAIREMAGTIQEREQELQTSQAGLAEAQRLARLGSWSWDVSRGRLLCSDEIFRILGVPKSSLTGEYAFLLPLVHEDDRQRVTRLLEAALNQGVGYDADYRIVRPTGDIQVVHEKVEVKREDGSTTRILGTLQLVTELKKIERELRQAKADSDSSLRRSQQQLEVARTQLIQSEKLAAIGQLAAGVAHEINTPIGYINSNFHTLQYYATLLEQLFAAYAEVRDQLPDGHPGKERIVTVERDIDLPFLRDDLPKLVFESREGGERVKKIVMDLKNFARQEEAHWEQARINELCEHSLNIVYNEIKYKAEVVKEYGDPPPIRCLPVQLEQVLVNLLVNAAQAIEERGTITLRTGNDDGEVFIEVEDTGCGIAPEHVARLFEPFFTTKPPGSGTGLGLSISYTIVQRHGGEIRVRSTPGKGSVFRVVLPVEPVLQANLV